MFLFTKRFVVPFFAYAGGNRQTLAGGSPDILSVGSVLSGLWWGWSLPFGMGINSNWWNGVGRKNYVYEKYKANTATFKRTKKCTPNIKQTTVYIFTISATPTKSLLERCSRLKRCKLLSSHQDGCKEIDRGSPKLEYGAWILCNCYFVTMLHCEALSSLYEVPPLRITPSVNLMMKRLCRCRRISL